MLGGVDISLRRQLWCMPRCPDPPPCSGALALASRIYYVAREESRKQRLLVQLLHQCHAVMHKRGVSRIVLRGPRTRPSRLPGVCLQTQHFTTLDGRGERELPPVSDGEFPVEGDASGVGEDAGVLVNIGGEVGVGGIDGDCGCW